MQNNNGQDAVSAPDPERFAWSTLDALSAHLALLDDRGTIVAVNRAWREFAVANSPSESSATAWVGANYLRICDEALGPWSEEASGMAVAIRAILDGRQKEYTCEYPCHSPDQERWFSARVTGFIKDGRAHAVIAHENITPRKLAEQAIASERALLKTIIDNVPVAVYAKDAACRKVLVNSVDLANLGKTESEVMGSTDMEVLPREIAEACMADDWTVISNGVSIIDREELIATETGQGRWLLTSKIPWRDAGGNIVGLVGIGHDITERRRSEVALREREQRLDFLLTSTPAVIYTCRAAGDYGATFVSENVQRLLGYESGDYTSNPAFWSSHVHPEDSQQVFAGIAQLFANDHGVYEYRFRHRDGTYRWLRDEVNLLRDDAGCPTEMIGFWIDITKRKEAEAALQDQKDNLSAIFTASPVGMLLLDEDTRITQANAETADLVSRPLADIIGQRGGGGLGCVHSTEDERGCGFAPACGHCALRRGFDQVLESGTSLHGSVIQSTLLIGGEEHDLWLKVSAEPVTISGRKHIILAIDNVTDQQRGEEALRLKNLLLATQQETTLDGILVVDETSHRIISHNRRFVEMWNIPDELLLSGVDGPVLQHNLGQVADPVSFVARVRYLNEHMEETSQDEFQLKSGRTFARYSAPMTGPDGRCYGRVWYFRDVTQEREAEEAVRESELRYRTLADSGQALIWTSGLDGGCDYFNQTWLTFTGRSMEQGRGTGWVEGVHPDDRTACVQTYSDAFARRDPFAITYRMLRHDGEYRWIQDNGTPRYDSRGSFLGYIGHCLDITGRMLAEETLRDSEARYKAVTQSANDAIVTADSDGAIVGWNRGAENIFGYSEAEVIGLPVTVLMAERLRTQHLIGFSHAASTRERVAPNKPTELTGQRKDGSEFPLELSVSEWEVNNRLHFTSIIRDITERKAMQERMTYQAYHDPLTSLPNRVLLQERLARSLVRCARSGKRIAVLFLDLDNFKLINDSLGHAVGDHLLVSVAERIQRVLRASDTAARFGGDEFTILLEDIESEDDARAVAERILAQFRRPITLATHEVFVNASIGIALSASSTDEPVELMRNADAAMYAAKSHGRGRYEVFHSRMNAHALRRLEMESELRRAVERKELILHYQPIISLNTGAVRGFEALVRWNHPTRGIISPLDFVPLAEETGLILPVGRWVLHEACRQMQEWIARHPNNVDRYVAVNLSAPQFQQASLIDEVTAALEMWSLPPHCLTLEITESVVMDETEFTLVTLAALKAAGVRISIDDFGTGYSSLSYLRRFPVDYLKIDRSFISGLGNGSEDGLIVSSTISLAHSLGLKVVAEGAESAEQVSLLRGLSCDAVQGFYFHAALPATEIDNLLAAGRISVLPDAASAPTVRMQRTKDALPAGVQPYRHRISHVNTIPDTLGNGSRIVDG